MARYACGSGSWMKSIRVTIRGTGIAFRAVREIGRIIVPGAKVINSQGTSRVADFDIKALVIDNYVLRTRSASDERVLGALCEHPDLVGLIFAQSCAGAGEISGEEDRCTRTCRELSAGRAIAMPARRACYQCRTCGQGG